MPLALSLTLEHLYLVEIERGEVQISISERWDRWALVRFCCGQPLSKKCGINCSIKELSSFFYALLHKPRFFGTQSNLASTLGPRRYNCQLSGTFLLFMRFGGSSVWAESRSSLRSPIDRKSNGKRTFFDNVLKTSISGVQASPYAVRGGVEPFLARVWRVFVPWFHWH